MAKTMMMLLTVLLSLGATCSVDQEVKGLQELKDKCESLELELAGLKAKKWTKLIDEKMAECEDHGFLKPKPKRKYKKGLTEKDLDW